MRRTILTTQIQDEICKRLSVGTPIDVTCSHVNVSTASYHRWVDRGKQVLRRLEEFAEINPDGEGAMPDGLTANDLTFAGFAEATEKARANAHITALGVIQKAAAEGTWQAAAWYLERAYPKIYARRNGDRLDAEESREGGPTELLTVTEERREAIILKLQEHLPSGTDG